MSTSDVEIANTALRLIGGKRITSFDDGSKNADSVSDIYGPLRQHLLAHPWNFSTLRVQLAQLSTAPAFGYDNAYTMPSDWIYTVQVSGDDEGLGIVEYREEQQGSQNVILSNEDEIYLLYSRDEEDPNLWSPNFRRAMATALARDLAIDIAGSNALHARMEIRARRALSKAQSTDAITDFPRSRPRGSWANSRSGLRSRRGFSRT